MTTQENGIEIRIEGSVGIITLTRPARHNSLLPAARGTMLAALRRFEEAQPVRSVLIRAQGANFCAGVDLHAFRSLRSDAALLAAFLAEGHALLAALEHSPLPVVAAVQGLCLAGGLELVLACDLVIAADTARFGDVHARYGLMPANGGTQRLPRAVGLSRALDLMLSGRQIDVAEAASWGLVSRVVPDALLDTEALRCCTVLAAGSAPAVAAVKRLARGATEVDMNRGLEAETAASLALLKSADVAEGLDAFAAKRTPRFAPRG